LLSNLFRSQFFCFLLLMVWGVIIDIIDHKFKLLLVR
jgi:hypothetical protein